LKTLFKSIFVIFFFIFSASSYALGIGSPELKSSLGEPLIVDVPITAPGRFALADLRAERAPKTVYEQLGGQDRRFIKGLETKLLEKGGKLYVRITTDQSFKEPFFDMILQVKWPAGVINKQLTVFIDP